MSSTQSLQNIIANTASVSGVTEDIDALNSDQQLKKYKADRYRADTQSRQWLAEWAAVVVTLWLLFVVIVLITNKSSNLALSDTVLSVLLGTTTLNILGLMFIVLKGYFKDDKTD